MLFHLIKKDFIIIKKYVYLMLIVAILLPLFILWRIPTLADSLSLLVTAPFCIFLLLQYVFLKEYQYSKAEAYLCATPYPRSTIVKSKYGFCIIIFVVCSIIYFIETHIIPGMGRFNFNMALGVFFGLSIFISIFLPIQFKLGYEKTKFIFIIIIMAIPFLLPQLIKYSNSFNFYKTTSISTTSLYIIVTLISFIALYLSMLISVNIYSHKDLV